jgi:hypothetical protein
MKKKEHVPPHTSMSRPGVVLQSGRPYLADTDNGVTTRTWRNAIEALTDTKQGANQERWLRVAKDRTLAPLLPQFIIETKGEALLNAMHAGTISTNVFLRRLHNFCVDMNWLPWPLIPKRQWPAVKFKDKRAITLEEHQRIIAAEVTSRLGQHSSRRALPTGNKLKPELQLTAFAVLSPNFARFCKYSSFSSSIIRVLLRGRGRRGGRLGCVFASTLFPLNPVIVAAGRTALRWWPAA